MRPPRLHAISDIPVVSQKQVNTRKVPDKVLTRDLSPVAGLREWQARHPRVTQACGLELSCGVYAQFAHGEKESILQQLPSVSDHNFFVFH